MSWIRNNLLYILIFVLAVFLLLFALQLQYLLRQVQPSGQPQTGAQGDAVAFLPTPTPVLPTAVVLVATLPPPSLTPTLTPVPPTPTPVPPTATATLPPTPTFTATALPPTSPPTSVPTTAAVIRPMARAATNKLQAPRVDFRLGYIDRGDDCPLITKIVQTILETELDYQVSTVAFTTPDELFATLTANDDQQKIDWTMCYLDPTDRPFLQKYGGFFVVIGGSYWRASDNNYQIMANGLRKKVIQQDQPCVYALLKNFTLKDAPISGQGAAAWLAAHKDRIRTWTSCQ